MNIESLMENLNAKVASKANVEENGVLPTQEKPLERPMGRHSEGAKVKMSNALISATHDLNLNERRLIYLGMALLTNGNEIQINAKDFGEVFGVDEANAYGHLKEACGKIFEREIRFTDGRKTTRARWVQSATYHSGEGWCSLKFTDVVCANIKGLQVQYTRYALAKAGDLKSIYSWRLMERFLQFGDPKKHYKGWWQIPIVELCEFLELSEFYLEWRHLRQKILLPATKELGEKDHWEVEIEPLKTGRKTTHVKFTFKQNTQQKLDF